MSEVVALDRRGQAVSVDAHEYAKKIGHAVTIDNGDGTTSVYYEDGSTDIVEPGE